MFDALNQIVLAIMDALLGWTLSLPRDAVLIALACGTALMMVLIRKFTTDQDLLKRCSADKRRLKELKLEAKVRGDKESPARIRQTLHQVSQKVMRQEFKPLLYVLLPMVMLTTWIWQRMAHVPPRSGEALVLRAEFPAHAEGRLVHLVPELESNGWLKSIAVDSPPNQNSASVTWHVNGQPGPHKLTLRFEGRSYEHPVVLGKNFSGDIQRIHDDRLIATELMLKPYKLFGIVPGIDALGLAPWMVAYLLLSILSVPIFKRVLNVY